MAGERSSVIIPIILLTFKSEGRGDNRREGAGERENVSSYEEKNPKTPNILCSYTARTECHQLLKRREISARI